MEYVLLYCIAIFELLFSLLYDILCVLCFLLYMFLLYVTVLLPVGVIKDDDSINTASSDRRDHYRNSLSSRMASFFCCRMSSESRSAEKRSLTAPSRSRRS